MATLTSRRASEAQSVTVEHLITLLAYLSPFKLITLLIKLLVYVSSHLNVCHLLPVHPIFRSVFFLAHYSTSVFLCFRFVLIPCSIVPRCRCPLIWTDFLSLCCTSRSGHLPNQLPRSPWQPFPPFPVCFLALATFLPRWLCESSIPSLPVSFFRSSPLATNLRCGSSQ